MSDKGFTSYKSAVDAAYTDCDDYVCREIGTKSVKIAVFFVKGISSRDYISERIIKPLTLFADEMESFCGNYGILLQSASLKNPESPQKAASMLTRGEVLVIAENRNGFYPVLANAQKTEGRGISEPMSDVTVRGPKAGFVEDAETNMAVLRQFIRTSELKFRKFTVGGVSETKVMLAYVKGRASEELVDDIAGRLDDMQATAIVDSANIAMLLDGNKYPLFPNTGSTEKVDKAASKLMSGRVAVIVDGSPFVLTLPYVFAESIQSAEDYLHTSYYATFIRALRMAAFVIAVFAPALIVAFVDESKGLPEKVLGLINETRTDVPLSLFLEMTAVLLLFELLREVGVRMPRTVGDAVGIVGSIVLGDAAVETGLISSISVITVALSAVCAFITPSYVYVIVLGRLFILVLAQLFGMYGLGLGAVLLIALLCCKQSYSVPYLFPLSPYNSKGMQDFVYADPKKTLGRREELGGE